MQAVRCGQEHQEQVEDPLRKFDFLAIAQHASIAQVDPHVADLQPPGIGGPRMMGCFGHVGTPGCQAALPRDNGPAVRNFLLRPDSTTSRFGLQRMENRTNMRIRSHFEPQLSQPRARIEHARDVGTPGVALNAGTPSPRASRGVGTPARFPGPLQGCHQ